MKRDPKIDDGSIFEEGVGTKKLMSNNANLSKSVVVVDRPFNPIFARGFDVVVSAVFCFTDFFVSFAPGVTRSRARN